MYEENMLVKLIPIGILIHGILFMGVMDVYFISPIQHGMPPHQTLDKAPARRVVLIVADGLRAESIFSEKFENRTPYLTHIRHTQASWGISYTKVPTESRPGHVSLMAGIYEDPSAIMRGWKSNPVDFDSVIYQSKYSWCWGSPDIVYLFNKDNLSHIHEKAYSADLEDFGKKETRKLDEWVFNEVTNMFKLHNRQTNCGSLCNNQSFFFLHLLGLDTAGHSHKPNSKLYIENMKVVDDGVKRIEEVFKNFYKDDATAYVFTSDHGMTDWGSHGDGSLYETNTPLITWGAGIKTNKKRNDVKQADIAPLLATLIGVNIPINSEGQLPHSYLNLPSRDLASSLFANGKQLLDLYKAREKGIVSSYFYHPFDKLVKYKEVLQKINEEFVSGNYEEVMKKSLELMKDSLNGLKHIQAYQGRPILYSLSLSFLLWLLLLGMSIVKYNEFVLLSDMQISLVHQNILRLVLLVITFALISPLFVESLNWKRLTYILCPFLTAGFICGNTQKLLCMIHVIHNYGWKKFILKTVLFVIPIELMVFGFFDRRFFSLLMIIVGMWGLSKECSLEKKRKVNWCLTCVLLAIFPLFSAMRTTFSFYCFFFTIVCWFLIMVTKVRKVIDTYTVMYQEFKFTFNMLFCSHLGLFVLTAINAYSIAAYFRDDKDIPMFCHVFSWVFFGIALLLMYMSPRFIIFRLCNICASLMTIYSLFIFDFEGPFMICFVAMLYQWLMAEYLFSTLIQNRIMLYKSRFNIESNLFALQSGIAYKHDFRRGLFFLIFILLSFFGTGNIASLNSFNPMWVRCFLTIFSPFTMMILILIKLTIPFMMVICVFKGINIVTAGKIGNVFAIVLLCCDIILFNFVFFIKNEGSWLEIGISVSHFIIMEVTALVLLTFYWLSYYFTNLTFFNFLRFLTEEGRQKLY